MYLSCASRTKAYFDEAANGRPWVQERSYCFAIGSRRVGHHTDYRYAGLASGIPSCRIVDVSSSLPETFICTALLEVKGLEHCACSM
jgi:hypothetical protein